MLSNKELDSAIEEIRRFEKYDKLEELTTEKEELLSLVRHSTTLNKYWKDLFFRVLELQEKEIEIRKTL